MKRTHLIPKAWTITGLMLAVTAAGAGAVIAITMFGDAEFTRGDIPQLTVVHDGMAVVRNPLVAPLLTPKVRPGTMSERPMRSETGLCPEPYMQSDNLWEARAITRCLRRLDRSRGADR